MPAMSLPAPPGAYGATDPIFLLLAAMATEAYVGDLAALFRRIPHPRSLMVRAVAWAERKLNRPQRSRRALIVRGALSAAALAGLAAAAGALLGLVTRNFPFAWLVEWFILVSLLAQRSTWNRAGAVAGALAAGSVQAAREALRPLAGERLDPLELERLPAGGIAAAALDGLGRRFTGGVAAPVFWYVLLGLPGIFLQQGCRVMAATLSATNRPGSGGPEAAAEGDYALTAVRLNAALAWLPERLAGLLIVAAAVFVPTAHPLGALKRLPTGAWPVAALGGALGISRGAPPAPHDLGRAQAMFAVGCLLIAGLLGLLVLARAAV